MSKVFCLKFPGKKRYGKGNIKRAHQDARNFQRLYSKNFRIYTCEDCKGFHLSTSSIKEYLEQKENDRIEA